MRRLSFFLFLAPFLFLQPVRASLPPSVIISEVAWMGSPASSSDEWIELYNASLEPVSLTGWVLEESDGSPSVVLQGVLPADTYFLLERTDDESVPGIPADQIYSGALNNDARTLTLLDASGTIIDVAQWSSDGPGNNAEDKPMERVFDGSWATSTVVGGTPGSENSVWFGAASPETSEELEPAEEAMPPEEPETAPAPPSAAPTAPASDMKEVSSSADNSPSVADLRLSEVLPDPEGKDSTDEFVEVVNIGTAVAQLDGWAVRDASGSSLPLSGVLGPGAYLAFFAGNTRLPSLNNSGDTVELLAPSGAVVDGVTYDSSLEGISLIFYNSQWSWTAAPTPNAENRLLRPKQEKSDPAPVSAALLAAAPELPAITRFSPEPPSDAPRSSFDGAALLARLQDPNLFSPPVFAAFAAAVAAGFLIFALRRRPRKQVSAEPIAFAVEEPPDDPWHNG